MTKEYYKRLNISESASQEEIRKAYKTKAKILHPDAGGDPEEFKKINEAYETLKNPQKRQEYDNPQPQFKFKSSHFEDIFKGGGGFEDIFREFGFFGEGFQQRTRTLKRYRVEISIMEAIKGTQIKINNNTYQIPSGVTNGQIFQLNNNEQIIIYIRQTDKFKIKGHDIYTTKIVSIIDCILGDMITVDTVCGQSLKVSLPAGSDHNTILKVSGYGMLFNGKRHNMFVQIMPKIPKKLTEKEKELYKQLKGLENGSG